MCKLSVTISSFLLLHHGVFAQRILTLWMMPLEPAIEGGSVGRDINPEIDAFNAKWPHVQVANTHDPLRQIIVLRNIELEAPNWSWIRGQIKTIEALERFANAYDDLQIHVRFLTWGEAFDALTHLDRLPAYQRPDVAQFGSTWEHYFTESGYFTDKNGTVSPPLRFINDLRLLFYWKRFPWEPMSKSPWILHSGSWDSVVQSLKNAPSGSLVFPIGLTINLLHDYVPLIRSGGGQVIVKPSVFGSHLDLTSNDAMRVPLLLATAACGDVPCTWPEVRPSVGPPRRLITFIDADHEELAQRFIRGEYLAIIEPVHFIRRWQGAFVRETNLPGKFKDYAAVAVPPSTFLGGSSLGVLSTTTHQREAEELRRFLTSDPIYTEALAEYGHLPQGLPDHGGAALASALGAEARGIPVEDIINAVFLEPQRVPDEIKQWAIELESPLSLDALQQVWRRMGDPSPQLESIKAAAAIAESTVNSRVNRLFRYWENLKDAGIVFAVVAAGASIISFAIVAFSMGLLKEYFRALYKYWKTAIAGHIAAICGLMVLLFQKLLHLNLAAARLLTWAPLIVAALLIFWAQSRAWKDLFESESVWRAYLISRSERID